MRLCPTAVFSVSLALAGCAVGPDYHPPQVNAPPRFVAWDLVASTSAAPALPAPVDPGQWWHALKDPELDSLVDRALRANLDLQMALARLQQVRSAQSAVVSDALPEINASGFSGRGTGSDLTKAGGTPELRAADGRDGLPQIRQLAGFSSNWELDLFGGYRRSIEAGRYEIEAAAWARNAILISVVADVAGTYVSLRGQQMRLRILQENIAAATQFRDYERARFDRGLTNELDLQLAERELARLQAQTPPLQSNIQASEYGLAVLLGDYPEALGSELAPPGTLPAMPSGVRGGLPLELLKRRPDVRQAERMLAAATAHIGVATSALFPHLSANGALGTQSGTNTLQGSHIWVFGPGVYWPLLDFGALDAQVNIADLQAQEQLIGYRKTVIAAVQDADSAIARYEAGQRQVDALAVAMVASQRAVELAEQRFDRGLTDFLNVIDARRQQYGLEDEYTAAQLGAAESFVLLYKALGGGWEAFQNVPPAPHALPAIIAGPKRLFSEQKPKL